MPRAQEATWLICWTVSAQRLLRPRVCATSHRCTCPVRSVSTGTATATPSGISTVVATEPTSRSAGRPGGETPSIAVPSALITAHVTCSSPDRIVITDRGSGLLRPSRAVTALSSLAAATSGRRTAVRNESATSSGSSALVCSSGTPSRLAKESVAAEGGWYVPVDDRTSTTARTSAL